MTPDPVIRLQSVIHTLEHVIVPAVDPTNLLAIEQCGVTLAQLQMLLSHLPLIRSYHASCADDLATVARSLPAASGGEQSRAAARRLAALVDPAVRGNDDHAFFHEAGRALDALLRALAADGNADYRRQVEQAAFEFSRRQSLRSRAWFRDSGFDPDPTSVPPVAELLSSH